MADKVCDYFPHIFKPSPDYEVNLGGFFEADHFAQLAVSSLMPQQCKSFSKVSLSASVHNLDERACLCYCLAPVNFFTHALITLAHGQYTRDVKEAMGKLGNYIEAGNLQEFRDDFEPIFTLIVVRPVFNIVRNEINIFKTKSFKGIALTEEMFQGSR